jgi:hypothetical protein
MTSDLAAVTYRRVGMPELLGQRRQDKMSTLRQHKREVNLGVLIDAN